MARLRYNLRTAFVAIAIAATVTALVVQFLEYRRRQGPIAWESHSDKRVRDELARGRTVIVALFATWNLEDVRIVRSDILRDLVNDLNLVALGRDCTALTPADMAFIQSLGLKGVPHLIVYRPGVSQPILVEPTDAMLESLRKFLSQPIEGS